MDNTIDKLQIDITGSSKTASTALTALKKNLEKLQALSTTLENIKGIDNLTRIGSALNSIASSGTTTGLAEAVKQLNKLSKMDFSKMAKQSEDLQKIADNAASVKAVTPQEAETTDVPVGSVMKFLGNIESAIASTGSLGGAIAKIGTTGVSAFAKVNLAIGKWMLKPVKNAIVKVFQLTKALGRIAMYRAIRFVIASITRGFQEGVKHVDAFHQSISNTIKDSENLHVSMNTLATSAMYLKNSLGAMVTPIINAVAPAIDMLVDKFVNLLNTINQVIARFTNAETWTKAIKYPVEYGEAANDAAKSVKKMLFGFDELNVLKDNSNSGSSKTEDYSKMFEQIALDKADMSNGLLGYFKEVIGNLDTWSIGESLGEWFNNVVYNAIEFLTSGSLELIVTKVTDFINGVIETVDWMSVGELSAQAITSLFDMLFEAFENLDWAAVGQMISNTVVGWFNGLSEWIETVDWQTLGTNIGTAFSEMIINIDWISLGQSVLIFFGDAITAAIDLLGGIISGVIQSIKQFFMDAITKEDKATKFHGGEAGTSFLEGIASKFTNLDGWVKTNMAEPIKAGIKSAFGDKGLSQEGEEAGDSFWDGLKRKFAEISKWFEEQKSKFSFGGGGLGSNFNVGGGGWSNMNSSFYSGKFADGGFPDSGSLFIAGEAGAELVGNIGGRTGVVNNDQFTSSMLSANAVVVEAIMSAANAIVSSIDNKDNSLYVDSMDLARSLEGANKALNHYSAASLITSGV